MHKHAPGDIVRGYRIIRIIGEGGCGAVYEAEDVSVARAHGMVAARQQVALKENFDVTSVSQLRREFSLLSKLRHDNLPCYYDLFEEKGGTYFVMEFVPGQSLEEILTKNPRGLTEGQVRSYAQQICDALTYLHAQNPPILHRDIKPANIRLTPEGLIKLVDFGLLKEGLQQTRRTIAGMGTLEYAPLEQYGRGGSTNAASDVYSLGATLYHLLTGQLPVDAGARVVSTNDPLLSPQRFKREISSQVSQAVLQAMALKQDSRFQSVREFQAALFSPADQLYHSSISTSQRSSYSSAVTPSSLGQSTIAVDKVGQTKPNLPRPNESQFGTALSANSVPPHDATIPKPSKISARQYAGWVGVSLVLFGVLGLLLSQQGVNFIFGIISVEGDISWTRLVAGAVLLLGSFLQPHRAFRYFVLLWIGILSSCCGLYSLCAVLTISTAGPPHDLTLFDTLLGLAVGVSAVSVAREASPAEVDQIDKWMKKLEELTKRK